MAEIPVRAFLVSLAALRETEAGHEVLLMRRTQGLAGTWCQVAGKIEAGERAWQAALRELREETGLTPRALYSADVCEQFYEAARDAITLAPVFVALVDADAQVALNAEHDAFEWLDFDAAEARVDFAGQRRVLRCIREAFVDRAPSRHLRIDMG
ncbi:MAG: NUDIX domain-containing protein [Pseudomonadota bacterium]